jgi:hypothetical protein
MPLTAAGKRIRWAAGVVATGLSLFLAGRFLVLIDRYSVNTLFWDEWEFYFLLRRQTGLWELFTHQHGPHRMGVGLVLSHFIAPITGWNIRAECFAMGFIIAASVVAALALKRRLFGKLAWHDAVIPLLLFTPMQYAMWAETPDSSHSAIPLLLITLYCLAWTFRQAVLRYPLVLAINFLALFTGFSVFLCIVTIGLLLLHLCRSAWLSQPQASWMNAAALAAAVASAGLFFRGYHFDPANAHFTFPDPQAMSLAMAKACGLSGFGLAPSVVGWAVLIAVIAALAIYLPAAARDSGATANASLVIVILTAFNLLFIADVAIGRISLGFPAIQASRYVTLEMTGLLGLYFAALATAARFRIAALTVMIAISLSAGLCVKAADHHQMRFYANAKRLWVETYLATGSISLATQAAGFPIYPSPQKVNLQHKLDYLRDHHLSFFRDDG